MFLEGIFADICLLVFFGQADISVTSRRTNGRPSELRGPMFLTDDNQKYLPAHVHQQSFLRLIVLVHRTATDASPVAGILRCDIQKPLSTEDDAAFM